MENRLVKLTDTFVVNLSSIYSVQLVTVPNTDKINEYDNLYSVYFNSYKFDVIGIENTEDNMNEDQYDEIHAKVVEKIGERPPDTIQIYVVILTSGKQINVDEKIFEKIKSFAE